jgi:hypothetical protein
MLSHRVASASRNNSKGNSDRFASLEKSVGDFVNSSVAADNADSIAVSQIYFLSELERMTSVSRDDDI